MSEDGVIFLPENVVQDLAGRRLPQGGTPMEFEYCGKRYRARQRDPSQLEGEIQCEPIQEPGSKEAGTKEEGATQASWSRPAHCSLGLLIPSRIEMSAAVRSAAVDAHHRFSII